MFASSSSLTPRERILKSHVMLMHHAKWCAFGPLLSCGSVTVDATCRTAYTDGWNVVYGEKFIAELPLEEVRFVIVHEAMHKAYRHLHIYKNLWAKNRKLANIAMDHFVNLAITDEDAGEGFVRIPKIGVQPDPRFRGKSSEEIFAILLKEQQEQDEKNGKPQDGDGEPQDGEGGGIDEHDWDAANQAGADAEEIERQAREIERAVRQGEHIRQQKGRGAGNRNGVFGDLLAPKVNWREALRQFISTHCAAKTHATWRKPSRRHLSGGDVYMPALDGKTLRHLVVGFDTSGSCFGTEDMTRFVSELSTIVSQIKPRLVTVIYCDWHVQGTATFRDGKFKLSEVKPVGGGGTDLRKIFDYVRDERIKPSAMVVFTDMFTPFPAPAEYPVMWAATSNERAPFGVTVKL